jgi:hypothetical protein
MQTQKRTRIHTVRIRPKRANVTGRYQAESVYTSRMEHLISQDQFMSRIGAINDLMPTFNPDRFSALYGFASLAISVIIMLSVFPFTDSTADYSKPTILFTILALFSLISGVAVYHFTHKRFRNEVRSRETTRR